MKNPLQFNLVIGYISIGSSFRQVKHIIDLTKQHTNLSKVGYISEGRIATYARVVCAINLQTIFNILNNDSVWAFSLANDASTYYGKSYFDNRIRFHLNGVLYNINAIAIPMFDWHTSENIFNLVSTFLDIVFPNWRSKLIGIGSDGANVMTGHMQGVVTRLEQQVQGKFWAKVLNLSGGIEPVQGADDITSRISNLSYPTGSR